MEKKTVLYNYLCLHNVRQGYLTVLRNIYNEYQLTPPPFNILILIQKFPYEKYFKSPKKIDGIDFIVVKDINGKIKRGIFEQFIVPYWALKKKVDAIYMPATFSLFFKVKPILLFFHVSVSFILPQKYRARSKFQALLHNVIIKKTSKKCDLIHCTTEQTRKELLGFINYSPKNVTVNYNGITPRVVNKVNEIDINFEVKDPFILCVSQFYRLKNQDAVISSFVKFKTKYNEYKDYKLILVGAIQEKDFFDELVSLASEYADDIVFLHNISDNHLEYLYTNCSIYVFLSIFEGFGLTPCEALFYNKALLLSDIPTLREIYGEYATFVDPYDIDKIALEMKTLIDEPKANIIDLANLYDRFNWSKFVTILDRDLLKIANK